MEGCVPCMGAASCRERLVHLAGRRGGGEGASGCSVHSTALQVAGRQQGKSSACALEMKDRAYLLDLIDLQERTRDRARNRKFS